MPRNINEIIVKKLANGERLPRAIVDMSKGWVGFGVSKLRPMVEPGQMSPTEFGYRTIVWLGRGSVAIRRKG